jgi:hypothetical protein
MSSQGVQKVKPSFLQDLLMAPLKKVREILIYASTDHVDYIKRQTYK